MREFQLFSRSLPRFSALAGDPFGLRKLAEWQRTIGEPLRRVAEMDHLMRQGERMCAAWREAAQVPALPKLPSFPTFQTFKEFI